IARIELVDEPSIEQVNKHSKTNYPVKPTLFLEFHGNEQGLKQDVSFMREIVQDFQCSEIHFETETAERNKLWDARHNLAYAYIHGHPGRKLMVTDVCLPITELAGAIRHAREALTRLDLPGGIVGHVGDGNYHVLLMIKPDDPVEMEKTNQLNEEIVQYALKRGGTCTGEHGVGIGKQKYQKQKHGDALQVKEKIKQVLDPKNILNPNKLVSGTLQDL